MKAKPTNFIALTEMETLSSDRDSNTQSESTNNSLIQLPDILSSRYKIIRDLPNQGSQAHVVLAYSHDHSREYVIKLYRGERSPKQDVLEAVFNTPSPQLVKIVEFGLYGSKPQIYPYEVLEYAPCGNLRHLLSHERISEKQIIEIFRQLAWALNDLHSLNIFHRDVKPENVLFKSHQPLLLVLSDYGVSSTSYATILQTKFAGTTEYLAPEIVGAGEQLVSAASDYWALGMILVESLTGAHPFSGLNRGTVNSHLSLAKTIDLSQVPPEWRPLCQGLLTRNPNNRWGRDQVQRWLNGERDSIALIEDVSVASHVGNYSFDSNYYAEIPELIGAFARCWSKGCNEIQQGHLTDWLRKGSHYDAATFVEELREDKSLTNDLRLFLIVAKFCPKLPLVWKEQALDEQNLLALALRQDEVSLAILNDVFELKLLSHPRLIEAKKMLPVATKWTQALLENDDFWSIATLQVHANSMRPDRRLELSACLLVACNLTTRNKLLSRVTKISLNTSARKCEWYLHQVRRANSHPGILFALELLKDRAIENGNSVITKEARQAKADEDERLWLLRRKKIIKLAPVFGIGLGSVMGAVRYWMASAKPFYWSAWDFSNGMNKQLGWDAMGLSLIYLLAFSLFALLVFQVFIFYSILRKKYMD